MTFMFVIEVKSKPDPEWEVESIWQREEVAALEAKWLFNNLPQPDLQIKVTKIEIENNSPLKRETLWLY